MNNLNNIIIPLEAQIIIIYFLAAIWLAVLIDFLLEKIEKDINK